MVGPGLWRETLKNVENVKFKLQDLEYDDKTVKCRKCDTNTVGPT